MLSSDEIASNTATVASSFDTTVTVKRVPTPGLDGYGHSTGTPTAQSTPKVNVYKPTATTLQTYAGIIGTQEALMIRYGLATDIKEGDLITLFSHDWKVQAVENTESYTFANNALITTVL